MKFFFTYLRAIFSCLGLTSSCLTIFSCMYICFLMVYNQGCILIDPVSPERFSTSSSVWLSSVLMDRGGAPVKCSVSMLRGVNRCLPLMWNATCLGESKSQKPMCSPRWQMPLFKGLSSAHFTMSKLSLLYDNF